MLTSIEIAEQANPGLWLETRTKIKGVKGKAIPMRMNVLQRRINALRIARRRMGKATRAIGLKPRKRGFSTMVAGIHYRDLMAEGIEGVIVGNKTDTSATVYNMMAVIAEHDGHAITGKWGSVVQKFGAEATKWPHGAALSQSSALGGGSIRGKTPQFVHGTEVAHWEEQAETLLGLLNAVPDDPATTIFLESTPNGTGDEFEKTWTNARWPTADECPDGEEYWRYWQAECPNPPMDGINDSAFVRIFAAWFEFEEAALPLSDADREHIRATLDAKEAFLWRARPDRTLRQHPRAGREAAARPGDRRARRLVAVGMAPNGDQHEMRARSEEIRPGISA
jgi:hypothetical protein